jgi:polar amino acid transport system substrate-binding protein
VLIEGCYLVRNDSPIRADDEVDRAAHRGGVGKGSAYDLYLTRTLQNAQIERSTTSPTVVDMFLASGADAAAFLANFVEHMKASGFVADALARHGIQGASVANETLDGMGTNDNAW